MQVGLEQVFFFENLKMLLRIGNILFQHPETIRKAVNSNAFVQHFSKNQVEIILVVYKAIRGFEIVARNTIAERLQEKKSEFC